MSVGKKSAARPGACCALLLVALLLIGCDGTRQASVIATFPRSGGAAPLTTVSGGRITLAVRDVTEAAGRVARLAEAHGGFVLEETQWRDRDGRRASLSLLLPARSVDDFTYDLRRVGTAQSGLEQPLEAYGSGDVQVTVVLHEAAAQNGGWEPARTFRRAFAVSARLFQLLVDALIWVVVVAGPFLLMAVGLFALLRRLRREAGP